MSKPSPVHRREDHDLTVDRQFAARRARRESLVVGLDGRKHDADALALARSLHAAFGVEIVLAHVIPPGPPGQGMAEFEAIERCEGRDLLARTARDFEPRADTELIGPRATADGLSRLALERHASMLVLGSSHRGKIGRIVPGGVTSQLLARTPCGIAVAPVGYAQSVPTPISSIGVAYDATSESDAALAAAAMAATGLGASLHLYHAMHAISPSPEWDKFREHMRNFAQGILDQGRKQLPAELKITTTLLEGDTATVIAEAADKDSIGLLFVGSRGYGPLREALLGGIGGALLRTAHCPLMIIPRRVRQPAPGQTATP